MANAPAFAVTPRISSVTVSTANTSRDGTTGSYSQLINGAATGTRIAEIVTQARTSTAAGMVRLFLRSNPAGLKASLSTGTALVTLTTGTTANLFVGQALTKTTVAGENGAFVASPAATVLSIQSATQFTVSGNHAQAGAITFSADGVSFFDEIAIAAVSTLGAAIKANRVRTTYDNLFLPNNFWSIHVSTHNSSESIDVIAFGADL